MSRLVHPRGGPTKTTRQILALATAGALSGFAGASSAGAVTPNQFSLQLEPFSFILAKCDGFKVIESSQGPFLRITEFFNAEGDLTRVAFHESIPDDTYTNSVTATAFTDGAIINIELDLTEGTVQEAGLIFKLTIPGGGSVLIEAGTVVYDFETEEILHIGGPHQVLDGDFEDLCHALA